MSYILGKVPGPSWHRPLCNARRILSLYNTARSICNAAKVKLAYAPNCNTADAVGLAFFHSTLSVVAGVTCNWNGTLVRAIDLKGVGLQGGHTLHACNLGLWCIACLFEVMAAATS